MKKRVSNGFFIRPGVMALCWLFLAGACSREAKGPANVVLVVVDTLRADALGCYGAPANPTPALDALAREGVLFEKAASSAPWTLPSFGSLFTSAFPGMHGAVGTFETRFHTLHRNLVTAAQAFRRQGYATGAVVNNIFLKQEFGFRKGFETYDFFPAEIRRIRPAEKVTDRALRWLDDHGDGARPFFLFVHYYDPHFAYLPPEPFRSRFGGEVTDKIKAIEDPVDVRDGKVVLDSEERDDLQRLYTGEVAYTDREIGRLIDHLRAAGLLDRTLVVVTADHGEEFWEHAGFEHGHTLYEELLHVPLILRFPNGTFSGRRVDAPVRLMDLVPTLLDRLGLDAPPTFRGESFLCLLEENPGEYRVPFYFEACLYGHEKKALRVRNLKLILDTASGKTELYDLAADPGEKKDLCETLPQAAAELEKALRRIMGEVRAVSAGRASPVDLSGETLEKLRRLGYIK